MRLRIGIVFWLAACFIAYADVPQLINYQGRVTVGGTNFHGTGQFKFALVGGTTNSLWSNDGTSSGGSEPTAYVSVTVTRGLYSVLLGDGMQPIPSSAFAGEEVSVRVWFSDGVHGFEQLTPDRRIAAVGYALMADRVRAGAITSDMLATGAVTSANIAEGAIEQTALSRQYRSGSVDMQSLPTAGPFGPVDTDFTVSFSPEFNSRPTATLAVESPSDHLQERVSVYLKTSGTDGFTGHAKVAMEGQGVGASRYRSPLLSVNGRPAVAYPGAYIRAEDGVGTSWGAPVVVDTGSVYGVTMQIVDGYPALAYWRGTDVQYVRALDGNGTAWGTPATVASSAFTTTDIAALAVINGNPAIAYSDHTAGALSYVWSTDPQGGRWKSPVRIDTDCSDADSISLITADGRPAVAYVDDATEEVRYARASVADGSVWPPLPQVLVSNVFAATSVSLRIVNGRPAVAYSYVDGSYASAVCYRRALDSQGSAWGTVALIGSGAGVSLAVIDGNPAVGFSALEGGGEDLIYARAKDADGYRWLSPVTVLAGGDFTSTWSLEEINGEPAMTYGNEDTREVEFIRSGPPAASINWIAVEPQ